jgi:hypothetical protein
VELRKIQSFVSIDIPHPGQEGLIKKEGFELTVAGV